MTVLMCLSPGDLPSFHPQSREGRDQATWFKGTKPRGTVLLDQMESYRRQTDVGYRRKPKVDVVCVPEMQASRLKGREEGMFSTSLRAQMPAKRWKKGRRSQRTLSWKIAETTRNRLDSGKASIERAV